MYAQLVSGTFPSVVRISAIGNMELKKETDNQLAEAIAKQLLR